MIQLTVHDAPKVLTSPYQIEYVEMFLESINLFVGSLIAFSIVLSLKLVDFIGLCHMNTCIKMNR